VCEREERVWLRGRVAGDGIDETTDLALRTLPGVRRYDVLPDGQLLPLGKTVPKGYLPKGTWVNLRKWMTIRLPTAGFSGAVSERVGLKLVRCHVPAEANVLLTTSTAWEEYASSAPQVRLDRLAFAVADDSRVVVRGTPLPPIRGIRFVQRNALAVPAGWTWTPAVDADVVSELLELERDDLALMHADGSWDCIRGDEFVRASRSAVRISMGAGNDA